MADTRKQEEKRQLILDWYKLLKPFHTRHQRYGDGAHAQLVALADDLSRKSIHGMAWSFTFLGGAWTVILVLIYLFGGRKLLSLLPLFGPLAYIFIIAFIFSMAKGEMRMRLEHYAEGYWVANDPFTRKQIYPLIECPECKKNNYSNHYLRYLEPCEYCGHNIDWEAAKIKH